MKFIILFRHFPTTDDVDNIYTSHNAKVSFAPLQMKLIENAQSQLFQFLDKNNIRQAFCSDNYRGIETAEMILKKIRLEVELKIDHGLSNILQPEWSGLHQIDVQNTEQYKTWHIEPKKVKFSNGESLFDVENRIELLLQKIDSNGALLISHTTPMQVILCKLLKIDLNRIWAFKFDHYSFTIIANDILLRYNARSINDVNLKELRY